METIIALSLACAAHFSNTAHCMYNFSDALLCFCAALAGLAQLCRNLRAIRRVVAIELQTVISGLIIGGSVRVCSSHGLQWLSRRHVLIKAPIRIAFVERELCPALRPSAKRKEDVRLGSLAAVRSRRIKILSSFGQLRVIRDALRYDTIVCHLDQAAALKTCAGYLPPA